MECGTREDQDAGEMTIPHEDVIRSLDPQESKVWICERLLPHDGGQIENIGLSVLTDAARTPAKLNIPKWTTATPKNGECGEGLRAPYPEPEYSWLDIKGGFVGANGVRQIKPHDNRAKQLSECGWT